MKPKQSKSLIDFAKPAKRRLTNTEIKLVTNLFPTFGHLNDIDAKGRIFLTGGMGDTNVQACYYITEGQLKYARRFKNAV